MLNISTGDYLTKPCAKYGLKHFLYKYGIVSRANPNEEPDIEIRSNSLEGARGKIKVLLFPNPIQESIRGYLNTGGEYVPLFETPKKLDATGKVLATFQSEKHSYPVVSTNNDTLVLGFDVFSEIGHILSGHLEAIFSKQDDESKKLMKIQVVDILEEMVFNSLKSICQENGINLESKPFWLDGRKFALCLTHDVDRVFKTFQYIPSILKHIQRIKPLGAARQVKHLLFQRGRDNPYWNFDKIMSLERELGVRSTFFFLNESGKPSPLSLKSWIKFTGRYKIDHPDIIGTIKKLHNSGFEIGVHGSYNSYKDMKLLKEEKAKLEEIIGDKIHGIRQHYLNFDLQNTFNWQQAAGFEYDTTLGFNKGVGFRWGTCFPFHTLNPHTGEQLPLLEIPLIIMDGALASEELYSECRQIMNVVEKYNGVLTLLWHQSRFSEEDFPGMTRIYRELIETARNKNAWIATANEIQEWWRSRRNLEVV